VSDDDDKTWLDALAGRTPPDPKRPVAREAQLLRESLIRQRQVQQAEPLPGLPARDVRREAELLARAEREGLIDASRLRRRATTLSAGRALAAAAVLAFVAIGLSLFLHIGNEREIYRGTHDGVVTIEAANPATLKSELIAELRAAGIAATGYERFGLQGVDAELPEPVTPQVRAVLRKHHLPVPEDGVLKVEITVPGSR
jgi:hypothetical protein